MDVLKIPEQLALQFLAGLPKSLETFSDVLSLQYQESGKELNPKSVTTALLAHIRTKSSKSDDVVKEEDSTMKVDKVKAACHHCEKKGHFKSERWDLYGKPKGGKGGTGRKERKGGKRKEANSASQRDDWGLAAITSLDDEEIALSAAENLWIADSGCSNHICNDRSLLSNFKPNETKVKTANGSFASSVGIGDLEIVARAKGGWALAGA